MGKLKKVGIAFGVLFVGFIVLAVVASIGQDIDEDRLKTPELSFEQVQSQARDDVSYDDLFRNNENFIGTIVYYEGEIIQSQNAYGDVYALRVKISDAQDVIWVNYAGQRVLEGDIVEVYGTVKGIKSYSAVFDRTIDIPEIDSIHLNLIEKGN